MTNTWLDSVACHSRYPGVEGKLTPEQIQAAFDRSSLFAYQPKPKLVFISNATKVGTVYTKSELEAVAAVCQKLNLLLPMDGARLGAALALTKNDMTLQDIYRLTDVFWIGGTKNGALLGEAIVIKDPVVGADFPYHMKQRGMLLTKGRLLGIQFNTLLRDDRLFYLARHANEAAAEMSSALVGMGSTRILCPVAPTQPPSFPTMCPGSAAMTASCGRRRLAIDKRFAPVPPGVK